ncbi:MAG TPA: DUF393 domain-containing protein [Verrucomicrobiae bacterium]|nr:DUF393 domain-containing protein [Verrucomicrobiae bacterium]
MTEAKTTTMNSKAADRHGRIFYDGECPLCTASVAKFAPLLNPHGFEFAPLQAPWVRLQLGLKPNEPLEEMKFMAANGEVFGGADAVLQIARNVWWGWPLYAFAQIPAVKILLRTIYSRIASNRNCFGNTCKLPTGYFRNAGKSNQTK